MSDRTGLAAEVPTLDLCREMAEIWALAEAFKDSALTMWATNGGLRQRTDTNPRGEIPAPTVREMLAWMDNDHKGARWLIGWNDRQGCFEELYDPDGLARACIAAAKAD